MHAFVEPTEDGCVDGFTDGRTRAHGDVGSVPRRPEAPDFELGTVELGVGEITTAPTSSPMSRTTDP